MKFRHFFLYVACCLLVTCAKEEVVPRPFPRLLTGEVSDITQESAKFHGEITYVNEEIIEYGFLWSAFRDPSFADSEMIKFEGTITAQDFEAEAERGMKEGLAYYVRAYLRTNTTIVFGNVVSFEFAE